MPSKYIELEPGSRPRGVSNRNAGLRWIYDLVNATGDSRGAFYFADDDNTYDIRILEEIRYTQQVSMFPVGFLSGLFVSTPILDEKGQFKDFYEGWKGGRTFALDMAGFAVNVAHFVAQAGPLYKAGNDSIMAFKVGYEEETFLQAMNVPPSQVEFLAENCTKIYVWHTKTVNPGFSNFKNISDEENHGTNLGPLNKYWCLYLGDRPCD